MNQKKNKKATEKKNQKELVFIANEEVQFTQVSCFHFTLSIFIHKMQCAHEKKTRIKSRVERMIGFVIFTGFFVWHHEPLTISDQKNFIKIMYTITINYD